jgi:hypothetical protein
MEQNPFSDEILNDFKKRCFAKDEYVTLEDGRRIRKLARAQFLRENRLARKREREARRYKGHKAKEKTRQYRAKYYYSDKAREKREAEQDARYHRPFIAIDAEGRSYKGRDLSDGLGNKYPLHRMVLLGAAGWVRSKEADAQKTDGKETPAYWLKHDDESPLDDIAEKFEFLLSLPDKFGPEQGFEHGVRFVIFAGNYDVTQFFIGLEALAPKDRKNPKLWALGKLRQICRNRMASGLKTNAPCVIGPYAVKYLKSKTFELWKLRDPEKPWRDVLDENRKPVLKNNGKPVKELDTVAHIKIEDTFGFYQKAFVKVTEGLVNQGYVSKEDHDEIAKHKGMRDEFDRVPMAEIQAYCHRELIALSKALTVLWDGFDRMGLSIDKAIRLQSAAGAGAAAAALIRAVKLKEHYSPDIAVKNITPQQEHAHHAFFAGRIEQIKQGNAAKRALYMYDRVSAFPTGMLEDPSMKDGKWNADRELVSTCFFEAPWDEAAEELERELERGTWADFSPFLANLELANFEAFASHDLPDGASVIDGNDSTSLSPCAVNHTTIEKRVNDANILSMFSIKWKFPVWSQKFKRHVPFNPFPYRKKNGGVLFPSEGYSWIMRDELSAAFDWLRTFGFDGKMETLGGDEAAMIKIEQFDLFLPGNDERPYAFVAELFNIRQEAKTKKEYDIIEMAIKLALNSLYGKTVQSIGGSEENAPSCCCPYYGAAITAHCRSAVLRAALLAPYDIVGFMTDGIVSTKPLKGLANVKELVNGKAKDPSVPINLGDWEFEKMTGGGFLQSGVYYIEHPNGETKDRTRGADKQKMLYVKDFKTWFQNEVIEAWRNYALGPRISPEETKPLSIPVLMRSYITAGAACASLKRFELMGRWAEIERRQDIHSLGVKRILPLDTREYYVSGYKIETTKRGEIDPGTLACISRDLGVSKKKIAAALRTRDALRCHFLVLSFPAPNLTPNELSKPSHPDWLNAEYYDGGDEPSREALLLEEDEETAIALMG